MYRVRQVFDVPRVEDLELAIQSELVTIGANALIRHGSRIAITAGSRGITGIDRILRCLVAALNEMGARPFLVPCMGSHGGGTAEGQLEVLESLGITETAMGVPILSSVEVVEIARSSYGFPVFVDRLAAEADGIVVVNRIKPHTEFEGPIESGLMKMMAIGMGKHRGCLEVHKQTVHYGYREVIPEIGRVILERLPIVFGLAVVENVYDETALIRAVLPGDFFQQEVRLLERAKRLMARLPFERVDILVVDQMGKDISGTGMDSNVIGRIMFIGEPEPERPRITRIVVLDLTEASHGNAIGIGLADYTTARLVAKMDRAVTATNAITAMTPEKARIPVALGTDREAVDAAFTTIGAVEPRRARVVHIRNTLEIAEMDVAEVFLDEIAGRRDLEILREVGPLAFDGEGNLLSGLRSLD